jgi:hypothetical protein
VLLCVVVCCCVMLCVHGPLQPHLPACLPAHAHVLTKGACHLCNMTHY